MRLATALGNASEGLEDILREQAAEGAIAAAVKARRVNELRKHVRDAQAA